MVIIKFQRLVFYDDGNIRWYTASDSCCAIELILSVKFYNSELLIISVNKWCTCIVEDTSMVIT